LPEQYLNTSAQWEKQWKSIIATATSLEREK
jgi:hypothetical protein